MIGSQTALMALLGSPVSHSLSPRMQNRALKARGIDGVYLAFNVRGALEEAVRGLSALMAWGANLTIPFKEMGFSLCEPQGNARMIRAVNALVFRGPERLPLGFNTDVEGLLFTMRRMGGSFKRGLLMGSGGAARGCALGMALGGVERLALAARNPAKGKLLRDLVSSWGLFRRVDLLPLGDHGALRGAGRFDLAVNATSLGLKGSSWESSLLEAVVFSVEPGGGFIDMVYQEGPTYAVEAFRGEGIAAVDGRLPLLGQGAESFRLFTGDEPPLDEMEAEIFGGGGDGSGS
ncbi:MAG: shikimate dehydrogenase [Thermanaerothrix sp.]|nr:shikimate dehydrogenase [Thermanaerothrix sp.]